MRITIVLVAALMLGMAIGRTVGREDTRELPTVAKTQDRPAIDQSLGEVAGAQLSRD